MKAISNDELQAFFRAIEQGEIRLVADEEPQDIYAGVVSYEASNGWRLLIFNDANEYDYVEEVRTPDDGYADINDMENTERDWRPDDDTAWRCLGIPGYLTFRCIECGARLPNAVERGAPVAAPFVCGEGRCAGKQVPAAGTWVRVR